MPLDIRFSLLGKATDLVFSIADRRNQLGLSEDVVTKIKENLEYIQLTIKKIAPHVKKHNDTEELKQFLIHL